MAIGDLPVRCSPFSVTSFYHLTHTLYLFLVSPDGPSCSLRYDYFKTVSFWGQGGFERGGKDHLYRLEHDPDNQERVRTGDESKGIQTQERVRLKID